MDAVQIRQPILDALAASGVEIGIYTHPNGQTSPAMVVGSATPPGVTVTGLEVVILPTPELSLRHTYGGSRGTQDFTVVLKRWNQDQNLIKRATEALLKAFRLNTSRIRNLPESSSNIEQSTIKIPVHIGIERTP